MFGWLRRRRRARLLERGLYPHADWQMSIAALPVLARLEAPSRARLIELATLFAAEKPVEGCGGLVVDDAMRRLIALQACLLILHLPAGIDAYAGLRRVLLYPAGFTVRTSEEDELGVVTEGPEDREGEAWHEGMVVLNWDDVRADAAAVDGRNLVLHECAHILDMASGSDDGVPPLPAGLERAAWEDAFAAARADLARREAAGEEPGVDAYAAESPAEGFAVFTETWFECPELVWREYPEVADLLGAWYGGSHWR